MTEKTLELLYIIPNKYTDQEVGPILSKIDDLLKTSGLALVKTENLGKRKLAYPIKTFNHGYYILSELRGNTENLNKLNEQLALTPEILRHSLTMKTDTGLNQAQRLKLAQELESQGTATTGTVEYRATAKPQARPGKYIVNIAKEIGADRATQEQVATLNEPSPQGEKKLDVKELDSKLDELLKDL